MWPFKSKAQKQAEKMEKARIEAAIKHRVLDKPGRIRAKLEADLLDPNLSPARRKNHEEYLETM